MEKEKKDLAEIITTLDIIVSQLEEIIDSPLVSGDSSAYAFLVSARFASDFAGYYLRGQL